MDDISPEALELLREGAPEFVSLVEQAARKGRSREEGSVCVTLAAFQDDPMLLYAAVWYCLSRRVTLAFVADAAA